MPEHTPAPTPHRAVYGFSLYLLFGTLFIVYLLWAFVPTQNFGLTYLPDKYFAIFVPMLLLVGFAFFVFLIYPGINMSITAEIDQLSSVVDKNLMKRARGEVENMEITSWEQLKFQKPYSVPESQEAIKDCVFCGGIHCSSKQKPIPNARFVDVNDLNKLLFE